MSKSPLDTKKINEALTPDQVSKVEDKYKSIYSGMLKGNKKKLMKYIDPKMNRPNPDAMAMGRAINLVKKETEKETVNEDNSYVRVSEPRFVKDKNNPNFLTVYIDYGVGPGGSSIALGKETMSGQIRRLSAAAAMEKGHEIAKDLESKYNLEDIEVSDGENGKVQVFAVSDDFIDMVFESSSINERLATLVKEVYSEKQRKWACSQDGPEFDEMCKDTAISKKKLKEEFTSTVSKSRAKSELKQMLQGYRDDGMGKSTLKAVLAIDKDGKETKISKLEDFDKFEKGTKFSLKETTMNNDRLTELIKDALQNPKKADLNKDGKSSDYKKTRGAAIEKNLKETLDDDVWMKVDALKNNLRGEELSDVIVRAMSTDDANLYIDAIMRDYGIDLEKLEMFESSTLKEGIWSMGTVTQIENFLRDLNRLKDKYYNIVGSDDVFDGLDRAERSAEEMMMNAPENRSMNEELATTPIKDDIYAIGSRIYKDPYEAISLVATDQTLVVRDFARKDKKFKAAVMDYVKSKGLETSVDRDGLYIDTKPLDFKGIPLMNEKSLAESIFKKLRG